MLDKNGNEIKVGDKIVPADGKGRELLIVSQFYVEEMGEECLFGQQVEDPLAFSPLTQENLQENWILKGE
jgi:hypothetical protein